MYQVFKAYIKKCADSGGDINMALLQICTTPLDQGLPSPATLMFNRQVHGIMPVLDHKPVGQDCDDEHHSKLVDRQNKNNNNASPVFALLHIGSAVAVQCEDGGLWTHGTIVDTGDHNHHNHAYTIQLTPMADKSCTTDDTSNPHQSQQTHTYSTMQQHNLTSRQIHWWTY